MGTIPEDILHNDLMNQAIALLPKNYNFEIHKTVWQLKRLHIRRVALQFPEGLLLYACSISDILERFADVQTIIMGDVTYGACCVDDYTAAALGCDYMVHYGHSCLVPIDVTNMKVLYVFVDIKISLDHSLQRIRDYFPPGSRLALVSTIQFVASLPSLKKELTDYTVLIPQSRPLSPGEILGCTAPKVDSDYLLYIGDGRFHLEAMMIANPTTPAFRYDPYTNLLSKEYYDFKDMHTTRENAIRSARDAKRVGLLLSTLGRQGNVGILENMKRKLEDRGIQFIIVLISEITPSKLSLFENVDAWIQVACPRLSLDWGYTFAKPVLSPYEASVALGCIAYQDTYPMDYYAKSSLGNWTNYHPESIHLKRK